MASCNDSNVLEEGPIDGPLSPAIGLGSIFALGFPRLSPEGDELFVRVNESVTRIATYRRASDTGGWSRGPDAYSDASLLGFSPPTRGSGNRRMMVTTAVPGEGGALVELVENGGWSVRGSAYTPAELGADSFGLPFLSEDGLRLVFASTTSATVVMTKVVYADREGIDQRFRPVGEVMGAPKERSYGHITPDCGRYYVARSGAISYAPQ
ncbi:MAG: hypothetical protein H0T89_10330 [Deltaproteobacteria bacterium]|nr:hypothetical protein [Deltaproteobacteria bacterium]MDQ3296344.1 hypothetical protein [Myxococcota bacterium]